MVAVKLEGRLGNQLFQYAFIYAAAKKLNTSFYLDKSVEDFIPAKYFATKNDFVLPIDRLIFSIKGYKNIFSIHSKKGFYKILEEIFFGRKIIKISNEKYPSEELMKIADGCMYKGYFQSEKYFEDCKEDIRSLLIIKKKYINLFFNISKRVPISKKKIAVHIRRGDYIDLNIALPLTYYKKVLAELSYENATYIFISDDPYFIEKEFDYIKNKYISDSCEIIDLQFLINADICVLSNSSFSWWGAWLNTKPDKVIYAPKNWIGFMKEEEYPVGISYNLNFTWINT